MTHRLLVMPMLMLMLMPLLQQVLLMLAFGHVMALLTCASLSAICTNGEVGPGGAYYIIISRALGPIYYIWTIF